MILDFYKHYSQPKKLYGYKIYRKKIPDFVWMDNYIYPTYWEDRDRELKKFESEWAKDAFRSLCYARTVLKGNRFILGNQKYLVM